MVLSDHIQQAINISSLKLLNVKRKALDLPYIVHPMAVFVILSEYTEDEDILIAGLLHDITEGTPEYTYEQIEQDFNARVREIVETNALDMSINGPNTAETWEMRKGDLLDRLLTGSDEARIVFAADKIHNLRSLIAEKKKLGDALWTRIGISRDAILYSYGMILSSFQTQWSHPIIDAFAVELKNAKIAL